jgi:acyl-CoA dehydrogenase
LTTLSAERFDSGLLGLSAVDRLIELARNAPRPLTPIEADQVADVYARAICQRVLAHQVRQAAARGAEPGAEASVGKLYATETMRRTSAAAYAVLGPRGLADRGEWGTFAWSEHLLGAPGYRIAGGSDEIQRTIIAARVLRMRADKKMEKEA